MGVSELDVRITDAMGAEVDFNGGEHEFQLVFECFDEGTRSNKPPDGGYAESAPPSAPSVTPVRWNFVMVVTVDNASARVAAADGSGSNGRPTYSRSCACESAAVAVDVSVSFAAAAKSDMTTIAVLPSKVATSKCCMCFVIASIHRWYTTAGSVDVIACNSTLLVH